MHGRVGRWCAAALAAGVLVLSACGGDGTDTTDGTSPTASTRLSTTEPPTTSTTSTTVPPPDTFDRLAADPDLPPEEQVEAAYLHHWDVVLSAFAHGDDDVLELVLTGEALQVRRDQLAFLLAQDQRTTGSVDHDLTVEITSDTEARVVDVETSHLTTIDADGTVVDDAGGSATTNEYRLVLQDGAWLVASALRTG